MKSRTIRRFGKIGDAIGVPDLTEVQLKSYDRFLQLEASPTKRKDSGLEALFREIFPIVSYDKSMELEFIAYELEKPRYTVQQCRELRLTYGYPLKIRCLLKRRDTDDIPVFDPRSRFHYFFTADAALQARVYPCLFRRFNLYFRDSVKIPAFRVQDQPHLFLFLFLDGG